MYIYIYNWLEVTNRVFKSYRSKMSLSLTHIFSRKTDNVPSMLFPPVNGLMVTHALGHFHLNR